MENIFLANKRVIFEVAQANGVDVGVGLAMVVSDLREGAEQYGEYPAEFAASAAENKDRLGAWQNEFNQAYVDDYRAGKVWKLSEL